MRPTKSATSSARKHSAATASARHGAPWRSRAPARRPPHAEAFPRTQMRKSLLDLLVAQPQPVVFGIGDRRRILLIIAPVVLPDVGGKPFVLHPGSRLAELSDRIVAVGLTS